MRAHIKVSEPSTLIKDSITHVSVYSNRKLSEGKAIKAAQDALRAYGFIVTDATYDRCSGRSAMVSARIQ